MEAIAPNSPGGSSSSTTSSIRSKKRYTSAFDEALSKPLLQSPKPKPTPTPAQNDVTSSNDKSTLSPGNTSRDESTTSSGAAFYTNNLPSLAAFLPTRQKVSLKKANTHLVSDGSSDYQPPNIFSALPTNPDDSVDEEQQTFLLQKEQESGTASGLEEALLQERHSEAMEISKNMRQIRDISKDLATIVNDQQTQFDELEEDINDVHDSAEQGLTQLQKANGLVNTINSLGQDRCKVLIGFFAGSGLLTALVYLMNAFFL